MADVKIHDLTPAGSISDTMQFETDIGGTTANKVTAAQLKAASQVNMFNLITDDTDDITEGATNLFYTDTRADARIAAAVGVSVQGYSAVLAGTTASFTTAQETKLDGIAAGAEVNVQADWNAVSGDAQILNKPTIPTKTSDLTNDSGFLTSNAVASVNGFTGVVVLDADDLDDSLTTNKFVTAGDISKLAGIEAGADVTDATNVAAAGAIMDGDFTSNGIMKRTGAGTYGVAVSGTDYQGVLSEGAFVNGDKTKLDGIAAGAEVNTIESIPTGITGADQITNIVSLTTAEYAAIGTKNASTVYVITDAT